jgi:hypothetical protein
VGHQHGLDRGVGGQRLAHLARVGGGAPLEVKALHVGAIGLGDVGEPVSERADGDHQDAVAWRKGVDDGRLHASGPGAGEEEHVVLVWKKY